MPDKPLRPCAYPGCPEVITSGRYCPKHKTIAGRSYNQTSRRPDFAKTYDSRWRKLRDLYIKKHPLCELCLADGLYVPADLVHHKIPTELGGTHDESNLQSLCNSCHNKIHRRG